MDGLPPCFDITADFQQVVQNNPPTPDWPFFCKPVVELRRLSRDGTRAVQETPERLWKISLEHEKNSAGG